MQAEITAEKQSCFYHDNAVPESDVRPQKA